MRHLPLLAAALVASSLRAQDSARVDTLAPGVVHRHLWRTAFGAATGPWELHVVEVDLRRPDLSIEAAHATGRLVGRRRTSDIARALDSAWCGSGRRVLAAVNGDLFDLKTGENEGNQVVAGTVLKAMPTTDSPFDKVDNAHVQFAVDTHGRPLLERFAFDGRLVADESVLRLDGVNARRGGAAVLYTRAAGATTPRDSAADAARGARHEAAYTIAMRRGDTLTLRRVAAARAGGGTSIPPNGVVLSVADSAEAARAVRARELTAVLGFKPDRGPLRTLVGGWGRLVADGAPVAARADTAESILERFSHNRHPRTVVGFSRDSTTLFLVTVDGRRATSVGMTLAELADAVRALGAWNAMNLDGGGSAAMIVRRRLVNVPSDSAGERTVGNALLVVRRERRADCPR
ncbi:Protein of unknown function DUF2233, periplasmic [Gemmatirosa kalamazoonensis]|uniref:Phosphodiester glycosidase domain-containing protein n=1 Tax=Gemmatirosa kalamazoonensis TaxID=861299 RepID=W0RFK1_9BACT|nr:phosphodiester glycosidase family protein [Gemmatirosa kalamazoonensis]AHG89120.1 Protein of unknown function DUF2233, periplasmic [Gemmatirosa kalamazoonensis]